MFVLSTTARIPLCAIAILIALTAITYAQSDGSIDGIVKDSTGATVPGAIVTIVNSASGISTSTTTSETGAFVFPLARPGTYTILVEKPGFKKLETSNV